MLHCNTNERKRIPRRLFLSFDDGPSPNYTDTLLDLLAVHQIRASFFVVAKSAEKNPRIMKKMRCAGHLIGFAVLCRRSISRFRSIVFLPRQAYARSANCSSVMELIISVVTVGVRRS